MVESKRKHRQRALVTAKENVKRERWEARNPIDAHLHLLLPASVSGLKFFRVQLGAKRKLTDQNRADDEAGAE